MIISAFVDIASAAHSIYVVGDAHVHEQILELLKTKVIIISRRQ